MEEAFDQSRKLFALPLEEKRRLLADENSRGWTPFEEETLDPANQRVGDQKEGFYFGREVPRDSPEASKPLHGPNQWPEEHLVPGLRGTYTEYFAALRALGMRWAGRERQREPKEGRKNDSGPAPNRAL